MKVVVFGQSDIGAAICARFPTSMMISKDHCDVRMLTEIQTALATTCPDAIVNCAGVSHVQRILHSTPDAWREELDVNLWGSYLIAQASIATHPQRPLIFMASVAGLYGKAEHSGYSASKAGVISLVQSLGMEGHLAYAISPGRVHTKMREHDYPGEDIRTRLMPSQVASIVARCLAGKYAPGDNIILRKRGYRTLHRIDRGHPWKAYLNVQPLGAPKTI